MKGVATVFLSLAFLVCIVTSQTSTWSIIDKDFATIALANSFWADNNGYVAGGTAAGAPILYLFVFFYIIL
jgi:hypothetical protein